MTFFYYTRHIAWPKASQILTTGHKCDFTDTYNISLYYYKINLLSFSKNIICPFAKNKQPQQALRLSEKVCSILNRQAPKH